MRDKFLFARVIVDAVSRGVFVYILGFLSQSVDESSLRVVFSLMLFVIVDLSIMEDEAWRYYCIGHTEIPNSLCMLERWLDCLLFS